MSNLVQVQIDNLVIAPLYTTTDGWNHRKSELLALLMWCDTHMDERYTKLSIRWPMTIPNILYCGCGINKKHVTMILLTLRLEKL